MPQSNAYRIGFLFGRIPNWIKIFVFLAILTWFLWPNKLPQAENAQKLDVSVDPTNNEKLLHEAAEKEKTRSSCENSLEQQRAEYNLLMEKADFWRAHLKLRNCAEILQDANLKKLVEDAEVKSYMADINDPATSSSQRSLAFERLLTAYPADAEKNELLARRQIAAAERKEQVAERKEQEAERKRKRSQGVGIGMSKEDVLASSWGRPQKINKTTNTYGVSEQWVYGSGNYLYFSDGVLKSIQN